MVRLRKFCSYQKMERPYTRVSKYKKESYVSARPHLVIVRFDFGDQLGNFDTTLQLVSDDTVQVRQNSLESARQTSNRVLEEALGKTGYFMRIKKYPFHVLRENAMATGAGADRMSQGMSRSFGKAIGLAAHVYKGQVVIEARVNKKDIKVGKLALNRARYKLPCVCRIVELSASNAAPKKAAPQAVPAQ